MIKIVVACGTGGASFLLGCFWFSDEYLRIIKYWPRSLLCALHASRNRSAIKRYLPLLEHCEYKKGKVLVCVSGVATSARSSTPKMFTSPLTSFTRKDIVSPDDINQKASPRKRRGYVNVLADYVPCLSRAYIYV